MSEVISFDDLRIVNTKGNLFPYGTEVAEDWSPEGDEKDCDSHATWKQYVLFHKYGWPERSLRLACCFVEEFQLQDKETGEWRWATKRERYHCVLLVDFNGTTYVLDNRHPQPMPFYSLPYEWHKVWNYGLNAWEWAENADRSIS